MDAFAVSICKGLSVGKCTLKHMLVCGLYFGAFQAIMPFIGYLLGAQFDTLVSSLAPYIAFILLALIGINMIRESRSKNEEDEVNADFSWRAMLPLAVATSIDALAVGVSFAFLQVNILPLLVFRKGQELAVRRLEEQAVLHALGEFLVAHDAVLDERMDIRPEALVGFALRLEHARQTVGDLLGDVVGDAADIAATGKYPALRAASRSSGSVSSSARLPYAHSKMVRAPPPLVCARRVSAISGTRPPKQGTAIRQTSSLENLALFCPFSVSERSMVSNRSEIAADNSPAALRTPPVGLKTS